MGPQEPKAALGVRGFPTARWAAGLWADESTKANGPEPRRKLAVRALPARRAPGREVAVFPGGPARF